MGRMQRKGGSHHKWDILMFLLDRSVRLDGNCTVHLGKRHYFCPNMQDTCNLNINLTFVIRFVQEKMIWAAIHISALAVYEKWYILCQQFMSINILLENKYIHRVELSSFSSTCWIMLITTKNAFLHVSISLNQNLLQCATYNDNNTKH